MPVFIDRRKSAPKRHTETTRIGIGLMFMAENVSKSKLPRRIDVHLGSGSIHKHTQQR